MTVASMRQFGPSLESPADADVAAMAAAGAVTRVTRRGDGGGND
jgi:hypothetical protein